MLNRTSEAMPAIALSKHKNLAAERDRMIGRNPLMRVILKVGGLISLSIRRLLHQPELSVLALLGVVLAVGLVTSAGFFAQAVDKVILTREMAEYTRITGRPPFSARIFASSSRTIPLTLERAETLGDNVADTIRSEVGLPVRFLGLMVNSGILNMHTSGNKRAEPPTEAAEAPATEAAEPAEKKSGVSSVLGATSFSGSGNSRNNQSERDVNVLYIAEVTSHMEILEGNTLDPDSTSGDALDVWLHIRMADEMGMQVGETFDLSKGRQGGTIPAQLAGTWQAVDVADPFWTSKPDQTLSDKLIVRRLDYQRFIEPLLEVKVRAVTWNVILDENRVNPSSGRDYVAGFDRAQTIIGRYLPAAQVTTPDVSLGKFVKRQTTLTTLLLGFNVPGLGFLLYFLILTSAVIAYWQRRETTILIRRGMNRLEVLGFTLVEALVLFIIGCPLGLAFGALLARLMGYTISFLSFIPREPLPVSLTQGFNIRLVGMTLVIIVLARVWTAATVDRRNLVAEEREHSRPSLGPVWYRYYLDFLLIVPTWYAYNQLVQRGSLALLIEDRPEDLFRDPLLIVVPALFILTLALLSMRVFGLVMRLLDKLANLAPGIPTHLALRQLGRHSHNYINPLLLVIVSLGLGVYTLSMAASLDQWLLDRMYYSTGADINFVPFLETEALAESIGGAWIPPASEYGELPGVAKAARVGDYEAILKTVSGGRIDVRFLAVDRVDFPQVAWFRHDLAAESLGGLMNRLAATPEAILVSQAFLEENILHIGDRIEIQVLTDFGVSVTGQFLIAGIYRYFPTVYEDQITVVGNLEHLFAFSGLTMPHHIWMRVEDDADTELILKEAVPSTGVDSIRERDAQALIAEEQAKMERVGVFGTLSVSFLAATIMAAMGLLTYSYASLQERRFYFALLRAAGLTRGQVILQVALEYGLLTAFGAVAGIIAGSTAAELFVPLFRVTNDLGTALPPLLPVIAQEEIIPLATIFAGTMIVLEVFIILAALYGRLFDSLRLGY